MQQIAMTRGSRSKNKSFNPKPRLQLHHNSEGLSYTTTSSVRMAIPNGVPREDSNDVTKSQSIVGINFGNSYASIAVLTKASFDKMLCNRNRRIQPLHRMALLIALLTRTESAKLLAPSRSTARKSCG